MLTLSGDGWMRSGLNLSFDAADMSGAGHAGARVSSSSSSNHSGWSLTRSRLCEDVNWRKKVPGLRKIIQGDQLSIWLSESHKIYKKCCSVYLSLPLSASQISAKTTFINLPSKIYIFIQLFNKFKCCLWYHLNNMRPIVHLSFPSRGGGSSYGSFFLLTCSLIRMPAISRDVIMWPAYILTTLKPRASSWVTTSLARMSSSSLLVAPRLLRMTAIFSPGRSSSLVVESEIINHLTRLARSEREN